MQRRGLACSGCTNRNFALCSTSSMHAVSHRDMLGALQSLRLAVRTMNVVIFVLLYLAVTI
jgi:hypothetical protein